MPLRRKKVAGAQLKGRTGNPSAGGVSANRLLRHNLQQFMQQQGGKVFFPRLEYCTDNGAMIAYAGCLRLQAGECAELTVGVKPRWPLSELKAISSVK